MNLEIFMIIFLIGFIFIIFIINHPITILILIVIVTLRFSYIFFNVISNQWLNFIRILIYLGGIIILFLFLTRITPNSINKNIFFIFIIVFIPWFLKLFSSKPITQKSLFNLVYSEWNLILLILIVFFFILIIISNFLYSPNHPIKKIQ